MGLHVYPFRRVIQHLRARGVDPTSLLSRSGLSEEVLRHENRWFAQEQYHGLLERAAEALDDEALGVTMARDLTRGSAGLFGYCFFHQPTVRASLAMAQSYLPCFRTGLRVERAATPTVSFHLEADTLGARLELQEMTCLAARLTTVATRGAVVPAAVLLPGAYAGVDFSFLKVEPTVGAEVFGVQVTEDALDQTFPDADPELLPHLMRAAEHHIADLRQSQGTQSGIITLQGCAVDLLQGVVRRAGESIGLTTKERQLLRFMAERPNQLVTQMEIESEVWQIRGAVVTHAPAVAVRRLRQKIEVDPRHPVNLVTVRGEGWKLQISGANGASGG